MLVSCGLLAESVERREKRTYGRASRASASSCIWSRIKLGAVCKQWDDHHVEIEREASILSCGLRVVGPLGDALGARLGARSSWRICAAAGGRLLGDG